MDSIHARKMACDHLRSMVQDCLAKHMHKSAVFFADKLLTLSDNSPSDLWLLAQAHYLSKEYRRALALLNHQHLFDESVRFRYLAAKCLAECQEWEECLGLLGAEDTPDTLRAKEESHRGKLGLKANMYSAVCVLRGQAFEALENRQRATKWLRVALKTDPFCYEAYEALIGNHMLTNEEERTLIDSLAVDPEDQWLILLYSTMCKKYEGQDAIEHNLQLLEGTNPGVQTPGPLQPSTKQNDPRRDDNVHTMHEPTTRSKTARATLHRSAVEHAAADSQNLAEGAQPRTPSSAGALTSLCLAGNASVVSARADLLFCQGRILQAHKLTSALIRKAPRTTECMATHLACLVELGKKNELFKQAHRLVQDYPEQGIAWYGVGCYYLSTGQYDCARRYFGKATQQSPNLAAAWITYGHSFAAQDESDQALAAYRTAARLFPGLHQPVLGMGREYQHMNNLELAEQMYLQAHNLCKFDPLICNELGVLYYLKKDYGMAVAWLHRALSIVTGALTPTWQPSVVNLAHAYRRQGQYDAAIAQYTKALGLVPYEHDTFASLGYTYHLQGKLEMAIEHYHKALGFKPDHSLTSELLKDALETHCAHCSLHDDPGLM